MCEGERDDLEYGNTPFFDSDEVITENIILVDGRINIDLIVL